MPITASISNPTSAGCLQPMVLPRTFEGEKGLLLIGTFYIVTGEALEVEVLVAALQLLELRREESWIAVTVLEVEEVSGGCW